MSKRDIYISIVNDAVILSRNRTTLPFWERLKRGAEYYELQLAHGVFPCFESETFDCADKYFFEHIATWYIRKCSKKLSPLYELNLKRIVQLWGLTDISFKEDSAFRKLVLELESGER